jgi:zinc protease
VKHLTPEHVRTFYEQHWAPANAALIAVGSLPANAIEPMAVRQFDSWTRRGAERVEFDVATTVERAQIFIVDRADSVQSELRVGHIGLPRTTPDYFALTIANGVLGGVFTSRLNMSLREEHGFTYGVRSSFAFRKQPGPFLIQTAVATDVTARALAETLEQTRRLLQDGATEDEIKSTREYLAGVMPLEMQTTEQMAGRICELFVYGLSDDYLPQHRAALLSVTREEAEAAARAHIKPAQFAITIVGDANAIESEIAALDIGPIEVHSIER